MKVFCYRYMWTLKGVKDKVNVKIVTDTFDGLVTFEKSIKDSVKDLENFGREYVCEYDFGKIGLFEDLKNI